ncbi:MAG TPA: hypothetical protein VK661_10610 [Planctomycetota bacterium]|nr:hypothetical protein [Planctomycetota bacterium]
MLKRASYAFLALAVAAGLAAKAGEHGGRIKWTEPKNPKEFDSLVARSNETGRAILLYFTQDN